MECLLVGGGGGGKLSTDPLLARSPPRFPTDRPTVLEPVPTTHTHMHTVSHNFETVRYSFWLHRSAEQTVSENL